MTAKQTTSDSHWRPSYRWWDALVCAAVALLARAWVVSWAATRVPPTADGSFYHVVAGRIAAGDGYTWLWPDGVVTYAAHYPVGYPALLAAAYAAWGAQPVVAMAVNALLGIFGCVAVHALGFDAAVAAGLSGRARTAANVGALLVALSPTLVFYTPALMTEGAVGTCLVLAVWTAVRAAGSGSNTQWCWLFVTGLAIGAATLLRPQSLLMGAVIGSIVGLRRNGGESGATQPLRRFRRACGAAGLVFGVAALCCVPWTLRNCQRMERCVFVSANGGWNLLIGTFGEGHGGFIGVDGGRVPPECAEVFQEAAKDICFGNAGRRRILERPWQWLSLAPAKLRVTFDLSAAASEHLKMAGALSEKLARQLSAAELIVQRLSFLLVVIGVMRPDRKLRNPGSPIVLMAGLAILFLGAGAYLAWAGLLLWALVARRDQPLVVQAALGSVLVTLAVHAVFFGAGRYTIPLLVLLAPISGVGWAWIARTFDRPARAG